MAAVLVVLSALLSLTPHTCGQSSCLYSEYMCNGTCVTFSSTICNGVVECRDMNGEIIDEGFFCFGCSSTGFVNCLNQDMPSECVPASAVCDRVSDCSTSTDEMICMSSGTTQMNLPPPDPTAATTQENIPSPDTTETSPQMSTPSSDTTESEIQISTPSSVQCSLDQYLCGSVCLSYNATFCNGADDCLINGVAIDEGACTGCDTGYANCQNQNQTVVECVPVSAICNNVSDCSTNMDERSCDVDLTEAQTQMIVPPPDITEATAPMDTPSSGTTESAPPINTPSSARCSFDEYLCGNTCLSYNATFCNGIDDCLMNGVAMDELACTGCDIGFANCQFQNQTNPECVPVSAICNNVSDCSTNMDESSCGIGDDVIMPSPPSSSIPCANSEYICGTTCLPYSTFCNGIVDCEINGTTLDEDSNLCSGANIAQQQPQKGCNNGSFNCGTPGMTQCLSTSVFCDGISDCPTGFDEILCVISTNATIPPPPTSFCSSDEYLCASNTSLSCLSFSTTFCNNISECDTLVGELPLDEAFCTGCGSGFVNCIGSSSSQEAECVSVTLFCNGVSDCSSSIDETLCAGSATSLPQPLTTPQPTRLTTMQATPSVSCSTGEYICNGTCLSFSSTACNGDVDCPIDSSDEGEVCQGCNQGFYNCLQNATIGLECLPTSTLCNGTSECSNGFDEVLCSMATMLPRTEPSTPSTETFVPFSMSCPTGEYFCNGTCLPFSSTACDGVEDCSIENTDEGEICQDCDRGFYNCLRISTIGIECRPTSTLCNGISECSNGFDEEICSLATIPPQTETSTPTNGTPITTQTPMPVSISCSTGEYICNGTCLPFSSTACNEVVDCPIDNVDEGEICQGCNQGFYNCLRNITIGTECLPTSTLCNGTSECSNGFDEELCSLATAPPQTVTTMTSQMQTDHDSSTTGTPAIITMCPAGQSPCSSDRSICIDNSRLCDGAADCPDQSDETSCLCPMGQLKCNDTQPPSPDNCVLFSSVCNGIADCPGRNSFDEAFCGSCMSGQIQCIGSSSCIRTDQLCDGRRDCSVGPDESPFVCGCSDSAQITFACEDFMFLCLSRTQVCDGSMDCTSGRDESAELCMSQGSNESTTMRPQSTSPTQSTSQFTTQTQSTSKSTTHKIPTGLSPGVVAGISAVAALLGLIIILAVISLILYCTFKYKRPKYTKATSNSERNIYDNNNIMHSRVAPASESPIPMTEKPEHIEETI